MRVAILGGTGSFGRALAGRLAALGEDDIVIGSRDAARAQRRRLRSSAAGASPARRTSGAVRGADLVVLAVKADAALDDARAAVAGALGRTPLLCVASAIEFQKGVGMFPDPEALSLAERVQAVVQAPVAAGLHSIAAANLDERAAGRGRPRLRRRRAREGARARARRRSSSAAARSTPARSRARARSRA